MLPLRIAVATFVFSLAPLAVANNILLTVNGCTLGCAVSPFGMIDLVQDVDGISVDLTITLDPDGSNPDYHFHQGNSHHFALAFNLAAGDPAVTVTPLTAGFSLAGSEPGSYTPSPFGTYAYAIACSGCGAGYSGGLSGPLEIQLTPATGTLSPTPSTFAAVAGHYFSVDIVDFQNNSGNVADPGNAGAPEPSTFAMLALSTAAALAGRHRLLAPR